MNTPIYTEQVDKLQVKVFADRKQMGAAAALASLPRGTWNLCRPGIKPMSPALGSRFLTTGPPGKSPKL